MYWEIHRNEGQMCKVWKERKPNDEDDRIESKRRKLFLSLLLCRTFREGKEILVFCRKGAAERIRAHIDGIHKTYTEIYTKKETQSKPRFSKESLGRDSNPRPTAYKAIALTC